MGDIADWRCPVCHKYEDEQVDLDPVRCVDCDRLVCDECIEGCDAGMVCRQCAFLVDLLNPVEEKQPAKDATK